MLPGLCCWEICTKNGPSLNTIRNRRSAPRHRSDLLFFSLLTRTSHNTSPGDILQTREDPSLNTAGSSNFKVNCDDGVLIDTSWPVTVVWNIFDEDLLYGSWRYWEIGWGLVSTGKYLASNIEANCPFWPTSCWQTNFSSIFQFVVFCDKPDANWSSGSRATSLERNHPFWGGADTGVQGLPVAPGHQELCRRLTCYHKRATLAILFDSQKVPIGEKVWITRATKSNG